MNKWSYRPTSSLRGEDWLTKIPRLYLYYYLILLSVSHFICLAFLMLTSLHQDLG